jgi:hypothetical protein
LALAEFVMFAVTGLLMLPLELMTISADTALAGWTLKANMDMPKNNNTMKMIETILLNFSAFLPMIRASVINKTFETNSSARSAFCDVHP